MGGIKIICRRNCKWIDYCRKLYHLNQNGYTRVFLKELNLKTRHTGKYIIHGACTNRTQKSDFDSYSCATENDSNRNSLIISASELVSNFSSKFANKITFKI